MFQKNPPMAMETEKVANPDLPPGHEYLHLTMSPGERDKFCHFIPYPPDVPEGWEPSIEWMNESTVRIGLRRSNGEATKAPPPPVEADRVAELVKQLTPLGRASLVTKAHEMKLTFNDQTGNKQLVKLLAEAMAEKEAKK